MLAIFLLASKISVCLMLQHSYIPIAWYLVLFVSLTSVEIGDCALWRQKWLSMLALMLTICCTSQIVWHQSSMQKHVVCFKCYGNFSLPIIRVFFVHWFSTLTVIEYNSLNLLSQILEVIVLWMFKIISHGPMSINFFGLLALELEDVSVYYSFSAHGRQ